MVDGLNDELGAGTYDYIPTGSIGTDAIKLAIIYKPGVVTPVGNYAILDSSVDPRFIDTPNRPCSGAVFPEQRNRRCLYGCGEPPEIEGFRMPCEGDPAISAVAPVTAI